MSWTLVKLADVAASPWRNGGGVTRELTAWPSATDWAWRMSVAEVALSGPFSQFEGVTRWFAVLAGAGVELEIDGVKRALTRQDDPFCFDGDASTDCRLLDGSTQDFNLMVRDGFADSGSGAASRMARIREGEGIQLTLSAPKTIAAYACTDWATAVFGNEKVEIPPFCLAWRLADAGMTVQVTSKDALWMEIPA